MSVPFEAQRRGEQRRSREELGQDPPQRRRIRMLIEDLAAGVVETHERAADRRAFEQEARDGVGEARRCVHESARGERGASLRRLSGTV